VAKAKKKLLPKNFEELLNTGDLDALKAVYDTCDINARGGLWKQTALAYDECPDALARWLVQQGADVDAGDSYGDAPLYKRARSWHGQLDVLIELGADINRGENGRGTALQGAADSHIPHKVQALLRYGARVDACNDEGQSPLAYALRRCSNADIERMADVAALLIDAGAKCTPDMRQCVTDIGTRFEFHRNGYNKDSVDAADAALKRLYVLFNAPPAPRRAIYDGKSPIIAKAKRWEDQHKELWDLLTPSSGAADTIQGEVIRISGRISNELDGNGGANWDADFKKMADAFLTYMSSGKALPDADIAQATILIRDIKARGGSCDRMCALAVLWVQLNPKPVKLPMPEYNR
jgi:ankyrin repeat protein